nr:MAG TPA: hypothetical protein [Caudoviricetes sp.]
MYYYKYRKVHGNALILFGGTHIISTFPRTVKSFL